MTELWNYENRCWKAGYETVCGVDEAGRGRWPDRCALRQSSCRAGWTFPA